MPTLVGKQFFIKINARASDFGLQNRGRLVKVIEEEVGVVKVKLIDNTVGHIFISELEKRNTKRVKQWVS